MRILGIALVGLIMIVVGVVYFGPNFVDWNKYKPLLAQAVERHGGLRLYIDGPVELRFLPSPRFAASAARLAISSESGEQELGSVETFEAHVALAPLLFGTVRVTSIGLTRPTLFLGSFIDAAGSWPESTVQDDPTGAAGEGRTITLDSASVTDGTLVFQDPENGQVHLFENWNATLALSSINGPYRAEGSFDFGGLPLTMAVSLGHLDRTGTPATIRVEMPDKQGTLVFKGTVNLDTDPALNGNLTIGGPDFTAFSLSVARALGHAFTLPKALDKTWKVQATITAGHDRTDITNIDAQLGGMRLMGILGAEFGATTAITTDLALGHLDLGAFGVTIERPGTELAGYGQHLRDTADALAPMLLALNDVSAFLSISAEAISVGGEMIRNFNFETTLETGMINITALSAKLPGGTNITIAGKLDTHAATPRFIGRSEIRSDNLRTVLHGWEITPDDLPADRLRKVALTTDIDFSTDYLHFENVVLDFDSTIVKSDLRLQFGDQPRLRIDLAADTINLDAYLPSMPPGDTPATDLPGTESLAALAGLLQAADTEVHLKVGAMRVRDAVLEDVTLEAAAETETIMVRRLSIGAVAGAAISVSGTLTAIAADPHADMIFSVNAGSTARLVRLAGIRVADRISNLGEFDFNGRFRGTFRDMQLIGRLNALNGTAAVKASILPLSVAPVRALEVTLQHPEARDLIETFFTKRWTGTGPIGAGTLTVTLDAREDNDFDIDARLVLADGELHLDGVLRDTETDPVLNATVAFSHPAVAQLLWIFAPDFMPGKAGLGTASMSVDVAGDSRSASFSRLKIATGGTAITGKGRLDFDGPRPRIDLVLDLDLLDLDPWLPSDDTAGIPVAAATLPLILVLTPPDRPWSRERIDLAPLHAFDATATLTAESVIYRSHRIDELTTTMTLAEGDLRIETFRGNLAGGTLSATGRLQPVRPPRIELAFAIIGARSEPSPGTGDSALGISGTMDYESRLSSRGQSEFELVSALQGDGQLTMRDGIIDGIDLEAIGALLETQKKEVDLLALAQNATKSGSTPFDRLSGTFSISGGMLETKDLTLVSPVATGETTAVIDVPAREINARSSFRLTDHPDAPPIGIWHSGPVANPRTVLNIKAMQTRVLRD